jgi:hypothetical protein
MDCKPRRLDVCFAPMSRLAEDRCYVRFVPGENTATIVSRNTSRVVMASRAFQDSDYYAISAKARYFPIALA